MPLTNPDPLRYPGRAPTTGGTATPSGADTTAASAWVQQQPWYGATLASWGHPKTLSLGQRGYLARTAIHAGMNPDFGINTDGSVEDWSTPTGAKIALAAMAAWAGASGLGAFGGGGASASAGSGAGAGSGAAAGAGGAKVGIASTLGGIGKKVAGDAASNVVNNVTGGSAPSGGSKTAEAMALISGLLAGQLLKTHGAQSSVPPQLSQMLDLGTQRAMAQQPMFNAVNQGTFAMLPEFAKQGIAPPSPMTFTPSTPPPGGDSGGGMNPALLAALGIGGGVGLGGLMTGTNPYGAIVDGIKKLFQGRGSSPSGGAGSSPYQVVGPPDPDDPWNGDPSQFGGG